MDDIRSVIRLATKRLGMAAFLEKLHWVTIGAAGFALSLMIAWKLVAQVREVINWTWVGPALAAVCLVSAWGWWLHQRSGVLHVAIEIDSRLDLREKLSTALLCRERDDAFARAAVEDAINVAKSPSTREQVRRLFVVRAPRNWWVSPMLIVCAALIGFLLPNADLLAKAAPEVTEADRVAVAQVKSETEKALVEAAKALKKDPEELKRLLDGELKGPMDPDADRTAEGAKKEAFKKMNQLADQLRNAEAEKAAAMDALSQKMSRLNEEASEGPASDLRNAMARGDFRAAKEELDKLEAKMKAGELSPEDRESLQNQLAQMAQKLETLNQMNEQLAQAMKNAGMDPAQAQNPQAAQQAIQNNQNLTAEQKQALMQMAQAMVQANQMTQSMANAMQAASQQAGQQGQQGQQQGQQGGQQGMQQVGSQLSEMEMMQAELGQLQATMQGLAGQCQGMGEGMCQGGSMQGQGISSAQAQQLWQQLNNLSNGRGPGMGNRGQGAGGTASRIATQTNTKGDKMNATGDADSPIIGSRYLQLDGQIRGESRALFQEIISSISSRAQDETNDDLIPVQYQPAVREFYGEVENRAKDTPSQPAEKEGGK